MIHWFNEGGFKEINYIYLLDRDPKQIGPSCFGIYDFVTVLRMFKLLQFGIK